MNVSTPSMTTRIDPDSSLVAALRRHDLTAAEDLVGRILQVGRRRFVRLAMADGQTGPP